MLHRKASCNVGIRDEFGIPMTRPTLSVVVPTFNSQATIKAALESVYSQTIKPDEVLVIDDESSDNTCAIVTSNFPEVRLMKKQNGGPSSARNLGIRNARFEWIAFLDADDIWARDKNEIQLDEVARNPKAVLVACNWSDSAMALLDAETMRTRQLPSKKIWTSDILVLNRFQTSTVIARRAQLDQVHGFRSELDGAEDWDMWLRLSRLGEVVIIEEPLVYYRDTNGGYSKNLMRLMNSMQKMMERESENMSINPRLLKKIWAWHYLRFCVGFLLIKDGRGARTSIASAMKDGLTRQLPSASWDYLLPFLAHRVRRRLQH
ncbi:MAG: glycosyltransferase family A protein [Actinomycetota bacterium]|nr:glycosyltransferase family A protein [Actinomycetota bacterium]